MKPEPGATSTEAMSAVPSKEGLQGRALLRSMESLSDLRGNKERIQHEVFD